MRALVKESAGPGLVLRDVPEPAIGPSDVLIRVRFAGVCGTDLHIWEWDSWASGRLRPPLVIGHEFAGEIVRLGAEAAAAGLLSVGDLVTAEGHMTDSVQVFRQLAELTTPEYRFVNSMQTGHRKIPFGGAANGVGTNYHWSQVLPLYEKELADFKVQVAELKTKPAGSETGAPITAWPAAAFKLLSTNAETYEVTSPAVHAF